jgi:alkanesulfonate monooxygenase SsuD/methylene tetrahydromethanopterin reductase-like flavin-dependent oxidoreductase (luciferase family)
VKVVFFHLMPYRDLPDDFEDRYESVWVTPPSDELCDPAMVARYYKWNLDELELADRLGFDGVGVNEHHQNAYGFMASPNIMAAALARRTPNNSAIMVLGNTLALYSPALRVAEEFAMLDVLSDGRLAAGFPVGTSMDVNQVYGVTPTQTRPRFYEAHDLIMKAWTQPGPFPYNGRFNQLRYVNPWPKPLQKPHPPIWLAGGGSVETWEMAVTNDYTYSYLSFFGYRYGKRLMDGFWDTADRLGADRNPYRAGFAQQICVAETDELAEEQYVEHVTYFFNKCLHIPPYFLETPGYRTRRSTEYAIKAGQPGEVAKVAAMEKNWKTLVEQGFIIAGSPATVADRLIEACKSLRVGNVHALLQIGSMPHELTEQNVTLFAEGVLPKVRGLWADEGWEHRWWPQGARRDQPAATTAG